ncbi:MAG: tetratricopeptide repeat protein [Gallionella sp.]
MLTVLSPRCKSIILFSAVLLGITVSSAAQAAITDPCFNFLNAQDYARAESEAKQLLQGGNLNRVDERNSLICLGRAYLNMGRAHDALPVFQRVEALSQSSEGLAGSYNSLGAVYYALHDLDRSELYAQRYLKLARELGKSEEAIALGSLGVLAQERGDIERALNLFRESLSITPKAEQGPILQNIAGIHSSRKEYPQAIKLLREAIEIDSSKGDIHSTARHKINLGAALVDDKQYAAAEKELLAGLNAIRLVSDKSWEAFACEQLGLLAKINPKKTMKEAWEWMDKAKTIYREIGDEVSVNRIAQLGWVTLGSDGVRR